ncbi:MAG: endonuclease III domain-containing protein [Phycisphaerae bacterium]
MSRTGQLLQEMYDAMLERFGHQEWWPGETPLEVCVGAILTQNTNWRNVEKAIENLRGADMLQLRALVEIPPERLAELIKPAGYFRRKAGRLQNFCRAVWDSWGEDLTGFLDRPVYDLREDLIRVRGIGAETADSIILYAAKKPTFVVDTYTARILGRHELIYPEDGYMEIKEVFEGNLPEDIDLYNDYHAQLVMVGKTYCRPGNPKCQQCPLNRFPHDTEIGMR